MELSARYKRIIRVTALATAGALAVTGGFVWLNGMNDRELGRACGGMLSVDDIRAVLGDDHLDVKTGSRDGTDWCAVTAGDRGAKVTVVDTTRIGTDTRRLSLDAVPFAQASAHGMLSVPVGHGWSGLFAMDDTDAEAGEATTTLTLTCGKASEKSSAGGKRIKGLAVTVAADLDTNLDDPATRPAYVRIATSTAAKAAKAYGCVTHLGDRTVRTVGLPVTEDEFEPLAKTSGTCAAVPTTTDVTTARETARAGAPTETCLLADDGLGNDRYSLQADFGPYAAQLKAGYEQERYSSDPTPADATTGQLLDDKGYWGSAECPAEGERAVFRVALTGESANSGDRRRPTAPELAYARRALRAFAEHSAKTHGCSAPTTP
ncbi:hypothetical protein R6V09_19290 [Streptomyces sp. W16]|uniref:hypothetical protein n=1 Tax=Streptomyces sp. W16 TaxID=3076631 RepID=UPI00295AD80B|nr:hypothetical protein [Streptomyces sp. W16]MDV9172244.1 hypothetical protein [Streptomyces sp. W16]